MQLNLEAALRPTIGSCCAKATNVPSGSVTKEILRYTIMKGKVELSLAGFELKRPEWNVEF